MAQFPQPDVAGLLERNEELERQVAHLKEIQAALQEGEERYRLIMNTAREGIWSIDAEGRTIFVNPQMARMLGATTEEMVGEPSFAYVFPEDQEMAFREFEQKKLGSDRRFEFRLRRKDGTAFWASISGVPMHDASGSFRGILGMFTDITDRKKSEEGLARQTAELGRSNEELKQFAYATSHDLGEPLRGIINYVQLLRKTRRDEFGEDAKQLLDLIEGNASRMHSLLNALLEYGQVVNVDARPMAPVDMNSTVAWAMMNLRAAIDERHATIQAADLPVVIGNQAQLVQLFQNLFSNAIKYCGPEPPLILVSARESGEESIFSVRDNGVGIDPQYHQRIFVPFKRLHGREIPGTGIGLSTCKRIVENHGGRIWVESEQGRGATFHLTLPAR